MYTDLGLAQLTTGGPVLCFNSSSSLNDINTLIVPFGVAVVSALTLLLHGFIVSRSMKRLLSRTIDSLDAADATQPKVTEHIDALGGRVIFFHMVLRALCSIAVLILSVVTLLLGHPRNGATGPYKRVGPSTSAAGPGQHARLINCLFFFIIEYM
ncbi:hypothetical protein BDZ89DRAFT_274583 [Hymenopellis radicata]|nr:hypothetical protein BDZ89DRAFT_274583 [Hymenopellis radicata]